MGWTLDLSFDVDLDGFLGEWIYCSQRDHVIFDMLYTSVSPKMRKWLAIISALIISLTLIIVIEPTWSNFHFKIKTELSTYLVIGYELEIYLILFIFCSAVSIRYLYRAYFIYKNDAEFDLLYQIMMKYVHLMRIKMSYEFLICLILLFSLSAIGTPIAYAIFVSSCLFG